MKESTKKIQKETNHNQKKCLVVSSEDEKQRSIMNMFWCCQSLSGSSWPLLRFRPLTTSTRRPFSIDQLSSHSACRHAWGFCDQSAGLEFCCIEAHTLGLSPLIQPRSLCRTSDPPADQQFYPIWCHLRVYSIPSSIS